MTVGWLHITKPLSFECGICKETLDQDVIAHDKGGIKHPFHKKCVIAWLKINSSCPYCRAVLDTTPLLSWKDTMVCYWNKYKQFEVIYMVAIGIVLGALVRGYPPTQINELGVRVIPICLSKLAMSALQGATTGLAVAYYIRIRRCLATLLASAATTYLFYEN